MLWILSAGFGTLMLFFLLRRLARHHTNLEAYRQKLHNAEADIQRKLDADLRRLPISETLAPVATGVREMLDLHGTGVPCEVHFPQDPPRVEVLLPHKTVTVQYRHKPVGRVRTGCYWEVAVSGEEPRVCRGLDEAMRLLGKALEAEGCMEHPFI